MSEIVKRLRDRRMEVWEQAKGIADRAADENRNFTAEEQGQWDALNEEINQLDTRIKSALETEKRNKDAEDAFAALEKRPQSRSGGSGSGAGAAGAGHQHDQVSEEFRAFARGERGRYFDVMPSGQLDVRALVKGTPAAGGNVVPTSFYDRLVAHLIEVSAIMQAGATILNTGSGETIQVPKTTAHSTAGIVTENSTIPQSDPAFGQVSLGAFKYGNLNKVSRELTTDAGVDLEGYLAMQNGRALGNAFGAHAITGTGTGQPRGVITDATVGVTGANTVGGAFTADNLIDLFFSVIAPYRASSSCAWIMRDATMAAARKLKDTTGQYLWQPGLQAGVPDTILGKPVLTDPFVPTVAASAKSVVFGDMSQYFIRIAGGVRFERSDEFAFGDDLVTFRALMRADAALVDLTGAVKVFQGGT